MMGMREDQDINQWGNRATWQAHCQALVKQQHVIGLASGEAECYWICRAGSSLLPHRHMLREMGVNAERMGQTLKKSLTEAPQRESHTQKGSWPRQTNDGIAIMYS